MTEDPSERSTSPLTGDSPGSGRGQSQASIPVELLIVDDEVHLAGEMADAAMDDGYVVHVAHSTEAALDLLERHRAISVMISDVRMPGQDGFELTRQALDSRHEAQAIEVILITGHATREDAEAALRTNSFAFIRKPFRLRDIQDATARAAARALGRRSASASLMHDMDRSTLTPA